MGQRWGGLGLRNCPEEIPRMSLEGSVGVASEKMRQKEVPGRGSRLSTGAGAKIPAFIRLLLT